MIQRPLSPQEPLPLPPCGMYFGSGVYYSAKNYLLLSGKAFTIWSPQTLLPLQVLDLVIEENQGNLVQLWGLERGAWKGGQLSAEIMSEYHALEELGITPPMPDWEGAKDLTWQEWPEAARYAGRYGAGLPKFVEQARQRGLYTLFIYADSAPQWVSQLQDSGPSYLGYDYGERFSLGLQGADHGEALLGEVAEAFVCRVRDYVSRQRAAGWGRIFTTCADFHIDYEILAGTDIPLIEDFAFRHLHFASSLARGLYRQHALPLWGSHMAHEHFSWLPHSNPLKFPLLRAAFEQKYMAGCKMILTESGNWALQSVLCEDAPMLLLPSVESPYIHERDPYLAAPHVAAAQKHYDKVDFHSPVARQYRKVISDFYDFLKANGTPQGQPEVTLAIAKGHLDLAGQEYHPNHPIAGLHARAEADPFWYEGAPERSWDLVRSTFYPRPPVLAPHHNLFLSGTPYGMVDIVSFAFDAIDEAFLLQNYRALLFAGWNSATPRQYALLEAYVKAGGCLFLALPHLSTRTDRNSTAYSPEDLIYGGDITSLCGVRVRGKGRRFYWATAFNPDTPANFHFPRRFGVMGATLGDLEIVDPGVETLLVEDEKLLPVLLRRKVGKGVVYLLNSWEYPGALEHDFGPGSAIGQPGLVEQIYAMIARQHRGQVWITSDGETTDTECRYIAYSHFPECGAVCLQNIDFRRGHRFILHRAARQEEVALAPGEFRLLR